MDAEAVRRIRAFNRWYTNLIGVLDRRILRSPWSLTEVRVLYEIAHGKGTNARRLMQALSVDEGYLSRLVEHLVSAGMVARRRSAADGRVRQLQLSARGARELDKLEAAAGEEIRVMVRRLSTVETAEVVSCMARIQSLLSQGGGRA